MSKNWEKHGKKEQSKLKSSKSMGKSVISRKIPYRSSQKSSLVDIYGQPASTQSPSNKHFLSNRGSLATLPPLESISRNTTKIHRKRKSNPVKEKHKFPTSRNSTKFISQDNVTSYILEEQYVVHMRLFSHIIGHSTDNAHHLKNIKRFIEEYTKELKKDKELSEVYKKQIEYLSKENFTMSKKLEALTSKRLSGDDVTTAKRDSTWISQTPVLTSSVPRLDLQSFHAEGFHEEFMNRAEEFSASWREALRGGR